MTSMEETSIFRLNEHLGEKLTNCNTMEMDIYKNGGKKIQPIMDLIYPPAMKHGNGKFPSYPLVT